jgi:hypothetical protein
MKKVSIKKTITMFVLCFIVAGCMGAPVTFKSELNPNYDTDKGRRITAGSCGFQLLLLIPIRINGRLEDAYQSLMEKGGHDFVANIHVKESWYYAYVGTLYCTNLEATAYPRISKSEASIQ